MRISRFYFEGMLDLHKTVALPPDTCHYILHVLRLKEGANLVLFNGSGNEYNATVIEIQRKHVLVTITEVVTMEHESPFKIHLAQAISKHEKMDLAIQKAVELGVSEITPIITDYCSVKLDKDRITKRESHWGKVVISACEQSGRTYLPQLSGIKLFNDWIEQASSTTKIYCHPRATTSIEDLQPQNEILLLIGPEGGLSESEIQLANDNDFVAISLGPRILRTETAALAAIAILQNRWGDI